jgi:hypothetical protein
MDFEREAMTDKKKKPGKRKKRLPALPLYKLPSHGDIVARAKSYAPACIRALADEVANNAGAPRVSAANALLERGYGKVGQPLEISGMDGGPVEIHVSLSPKVAAALSLMAGVEE